MDTQNEKEPQILQIDPLETASLETLLANPNLSLFELLSIKNILQKIKSNFSYFIKHCHKNQDFCFHLIDIGIKCPMHEGANENMKQACYIASNLLTCDQNTVADLLIMPEKSKPKKSDSGNQSGQQNQIQEQFESLMDQFPPEPTQFQAIEQIMTQQQKFNKKHKYLLRVLQYISQNETKNLDQNCINYMIKSINCLLRKKSSQFLEFLRKQPNILQRLIQLNNFSSINQFLIKILSDEDFEKQIDQDIQKFIITEILNKLYEKINQQDFIERLDFLEQLFQSNKYASEDQRTKLQTMSDVFVSKQTIMFFYNHFKNANTQVLFLNAISYLHSIVKRMNVDQEVDPYSYSNQSKKQTLVYEADFIYKDFFKILTQGYQKLKTFQYSQIYQQKTLQTKFYEFLVIITKNSRFNNCPIGDSKSQKLILNEENVIFQSKSQKIATLKQLLKQFINQTANGINRACIIALIQKVLTMQIYQESNHIKASIQIKDKQQNQIQIQNKIQQSTVQIFQNGSIQQEQSHQVDTITEIHDRKKKIHKIKTGLKLNIKKFSQDNSDSIEKIQEKIQLFNNKSNSSEIIKKLESSLNQEQIYQILSFLSQNIKDHPSFNVTQIKKKQKNPKTQIGALINKIIMILCISIDWTGLSESIALVQKKKFIKDIEEMFQSFHFTEICKTYPAQFTVNKHPNEKDKASPELTFAKKFFQIYSTQNQLSPKIPSNSEKNFQLSNSDFLSDDQEIQAEKCTLDEFKKLTGFKQTPKYPSAPQIQFIQQNQQNHQKSQQEYRILQIENKEVKEQIKQSQVQQIIQKQQSKNYKKTQQKECIQISNIEQQTINQKQKKQLQKEQKVPLSFYIRHYVILI